MSREVERALHGTTDAMVWAQEWVRIAREIHANDGNVFDEGWMVGWFANAIEVGKAFGYEEGQRALAEQAHR